MPGLHERRIARMLGSGGGRQREAMEGPELTAMFVWLITLGVILFVLSPIIAIISIFQPVVAEKVLLPLFQIGGAIFCAPILWKVLPIFWSCLVYVIENLGAVFYGLMSFLGHLLHGLISFLANSFYFLISFLWNLYHFLGNLIWRGAASLFHFVLGLIPLCWNLFREGINIFIYRTPPFRYFWHHWTMQPRRFGWQSLNESRQSNSQLPSDDNSIIYSCKSSNLCDQCLRIVHQSGLLVGSMCIFTPRIEWHDWFLARRGLTLALSQEPCHLCNILWNSVREIVQKEDANSRNPDASQDQIIQMELRVKIWEDGTGRWYDQQLRCMQVYRGEVSLGGRCLAILEEHLGTQSITSEVPVSTGARDCILLANDWIQDCQRNHTSVCNAETSRPLLPTRLIDVGLNDSEIRLYQTSISDTGIKYLALSHCRGTEEFTTLNLMNHKGWCTSIDYGNLPKTFQDAIHFTRKIGERYVWIDSLCIIQNCKEDWEREAKKMSEVYAHAYCTISASGSRKVSEGCFRERMPFLKFPCNLLFSNHKTLTISASNQADGAHTFIDEIDRSPLSKRGWAFQERLLSRRIVHFGADFLFFECRTHIASELLRGGEKYEENKETSTGYLSWRLLFGNWNRTRKLPSSPSVFSSLFNPVTGSRASFNTLRLAGSTEPPVNLSLQLKLHSHWFQLVARYTSSQLTKDTDRLIAIDGIAQNIQGGPNASNYLAGLWKHHLPFDLLWYRKNSKGLIPQIRAEEPRAPSWSWGAIDTEVCEEQVSSIASYDNQQCAIECLAEVSGVEIKEFSPSKFRGHIDIRILQLFVVNGYKSPKNYDSRNPHGLTITIRGHSQPFEAEFVPDIDTLLRPPRLFCAEIVRVAILDPKNSENWFLQSHGIVLRRKDDVVSSEEPVTFQRVGRFWVEMSMSHDDVFDYLVDKDRRRNRYRVQKPEEALEAWAFGRGSFDIDKFDDIRII